MKNRIKEIRKQKNITQQTLAEKCNISISTLGNIENNRNSPNIKIIINICKVLECTIDEIIK